MSRSSPYVFLLSGKSGAGKTQLCIRAIALLRETRARVTGIVSPARFEAGKKTGIYARDILSNEQRLLAQPGKQAGLGWVFDPATLDWGSQILRNAAPCDVLVVDEMGPLELERGEGWTAAFDILKTCGCAAALITIRPSLIAVLKERLRGYDVEVISVTPSSPGAGDLRDSVVSRLA